MMWQEQKLCMFYTCEVWTFKQEHTHSRSAVGFNLTFGLVTLENPGIDHKIIGVAWSALGIEIISWTILYMNESLLLVKITYILVSTSHAKCWPFKYWWFALRSKVRKKIWVRPWWRNCVCVRAHACVYMTYQEWTLCTFCTCQKPTHSMSTVGFGFNTFKLF